MKVITDTGYQGIQKLHVKSELPKKKTKRNPLTKDDKRKNQELASERVANENVIGMIKRFKIVSDTISQIKMSKWNFKVSLRKLILISA